MPLPSLTLYGAKQCTARAKSKEGQRCLNPAAFGCKTCRIHGARHYSSIKRGKLHPNYRHGTETLQSKRQRSIKLTELKQIELELINRGLIRE